MTFPKVHRVLYAENDPDCRLLICFLGKLAELEITAVSTASEMWQLAQTQHFDLYLLSSRFSDGDGFELCHRLKIHAPHTPVVFYSGNVQKADRENGLAAGASAYLVKPYSENLMAIIRLYIEIPAQADTATVYYESGKPQWRGQMAEISLFESI